MNHNTHTALVTGANRGFGFEAAGQLAEAGYARVVLACRTLEKAAIARELLVARTGRDIFDTVVIDVSDLKSSACAAHELIARPYDIDLLVLNAGGAIQNFTKSVDGFEMTLAVNLFGHHVLTMMLLKAGKLSSQARIVIAGSESARADRSLFSMFDYDGLEAAVGGDIDAVMDAVARGEQPSTYEGLRRYANAKIWTIWWVAALARRLQEDRVAVAVSPGSKLNPTESKGAGPMRRYVKIPIKKLIGSRIGLVGSIADGSRRYVDAGDFAVDASGKFYGSPPRKFIGPMEVQPQPQFYNERLQEAAWESIVRLTGVEMPVTVRV